MEGDGMSTLLQDVQTFFSRLEDDQEGSKVLSYVDHDYQFKVSGAGAFLLRRKGKGFSVEEGEQPDPDWRRVTVVETDEGTLRDIMAGRIRPSEAFYSTKLIMDGMMANTAFNHCLIRLLRRGQELNR
jgi:hypothetical protein